jgi:hypothetical protein
MMTASPDFRDLDSDDDGNDDQLEAYDTDFDGNADTLPSGLDTDSDGIDNAFDLFNNVSRDWTNNVATFNRNLPDLDGDRLPDFRDFESIVECTGNSTQAQKTRLASLSNELLASFNSAVRVNKQGAKARSCTLIASSQLKKLKRRAATEHAALLTLIQNTLPENSFVCEAVVPGCSNFDVSSYRLNVDSTARKFLKMTQTALGTCSRLNGGKSTLLKVRQAYANTKTTLAELPNPFLQCEE